MIPVVVMNGPYRGSMGDHAIFVIREYKEWLKENKINCRKYRIKSYDKHKHFLSYIFWFDNEEDAVAFKLRWT